MNADDLIWTIAILVACVVAFQLGRSWEIFWHGDWNDGKSARTGESNGA